MSLCPSMSKRPGRRGQQAQPPAVPCKQVGGLSSGSCQSRGRTGQPAGVEGPRGSKLGGAEQLLSPRPWFCQRPREGRTLTCDHIGR